MVNTEKPKSLFKLTSAELCAWHQNILDQKTEDELNSRIYCDIDFDNKHIAKRYGARFDGECKSWYFNNKKVAKACLQEIANQ